MSQAVRSKKGGKGIMSLLLGRGAKIQLPKTQVVVKRATKSLPQGKPASIHKTYPRCINVDETKVTGLHDQISGDFAKIRGGDVSNLTGDISYCCGFVSEKLSGNVTGVCSSLTGLTGNIEDLIKI